MVLLAIWCISVSDKAVRFPLISSDTNKKFRNNYQLTWRDEIPLLLVLSFHWDYTSICYPLLNTSNTSSGTRTPSALTRLQCWCKADSFSESMVCWLTPPGDLGLDTRPGNGIVTWSRLYLIWSKRDALKQYLPRISTCGDGNTPAKLREVIEPPPTWTVIKSEVHVIIRWITAYMRRT